MNKEMFEMLDLVLIYLYDRIPHGISKSRIWQDVFNGDVSVPIDAILLHLEDQDHIYLTLSLTGQQFLANQECYSVTIRGMEFIRKSSIPNRPYHDEEFQKLEAIHDKAVAAKLAKRADWPKQNWLVLLLITFFLGIFSTLSAEFFRKKMFSDPSTKPQVIIVRDTIRTTVSVQCKPIPP
jgi:hypothetical protein